MFVFVPVLVIELALILRVLDFVAIFAVGIFTVARLVRLNVGFVVSVITTVTIAIDVLIVVNAFPLVLRAARCCGCCCRTCCCCGAAGSGDDSLRTRWAVAYRLFDSF